MDNILFIAPSNSSFIRNDIHILQTNFKTKSCIYKWSNKLLVPLLLMKELYFLVTNIKNFKIIIISFAGYWSIIPAIYSKIKKKQCYIILNGTECASLPEINYGSLRKPILKFVCYISFKYASHLLPVSKSLIYTKNNFSINHKTNIQGIKHHFPKISTPYTVIHNGIDPSYWFRDKSTEKLTNSFIAVFSDNQFILKGGDLIVKLAEIYKDYTFYIAGCSSPNSTYSKYSNLHFLGKIISSELRLLYNRCEYYFQLSIFEGFGVSLCEAMLCECIPIGSNVNIIPHIIGNTGYVINHRHINNLVNLIEYIISNRTQKSGQNARQRIINNFAIDKRENELISFLNKNIKHDR